MRKQGRNDKSQGDQERELWVASRRYMAGEIGITELEKAEKPHTEAFNNAMLALSRRNICSFSAVWRRVLRAARKERSL